MGRGAFARSAMRDRRRRRPGGAATAAPYPDRPGEGVRLGDLQGRCRGLGRHQAVPQGQDQGVRDTLMNVRGATASTEAPLAGRAKPVQQRSRTTHVSPSVERLEAVAYEIPTEDPQSDGTLEWDSTTLLAGQAFNGRE